MPPCGGGHRNWRPLERSGAGFCRDARGTPSARCFTVVEAVRFPGLASKMVAEDFHLLQPSIRVVASPAEAWDGTDGAAPDLTDLFLEA